MRMRNMNVFLLWQTFEADDPIMRGVFSTRKGAETRRDLIIAEDADTLAEDAFVIDEFTVEGE